MEQTKSESFVLLYSIGNAKKQFSVSCPVYTWCVKKLPLRANAFAWQVEETRILRSCICTGWSCGITVLLGAAIKSPKDVVHCHAKRFERVSHVRFCE